MKNMRKIISIVLALALMLSVFTGAAIVYAADDTVDYGGHTYKRIDTSMTWTQARAYCEEQGGYLATVTTLGEQLAIQSIVDNGSKFQYWLGGTDELNEGEWKWITGEAWSFWFDTIAFDNHSGNENYLQMQRVNREGADVIPYAWNDANKENTISGEEDFYSLEHIGFICEFGADAIIDDGTVEYLGHKYIRIEDGMTWTQAKEYCENLGGYLATVTSSQEQNILRLLVKNGSKAQYWLGGTNADHVGQWEWVSGEAFDYWAQTITFETGDNGEYYLQMQCHNWGDNDACGKWNNANNENHINGEESFYSTEMTGLICEVGTSEMPSENNSTEPIIYVIGRTGVYTNDGQPTITENTSFITSVVEENSEALSDALLKGKWDEYCDAIYEQISAQYADYALNNEGEVDNGSHVAFTWNKNSIPCRQWDIFTYKYEYDARLDPCAIADDLNDYIEAIKEVTGYDKVHLVSRCLGCNIATSYLAEYGHDSIDTCVLYASGAKGYNFVGEMFAGKFDFSSSAIARYEDENYDGDEGDSLEFIELIKAIIELADEKGLLTVGTWTADLIFQRVSENIVPRLIKATYGTSPGYWAMVNDENYNDAKEFIFGDEAETTYATLIAKLDNYHYNVQNNVEADLLKMKTEENIKVNIICKYGFQVAPFIESSDDVGDNRIEVSKQSLGATTSKINSKFSYTYLKKAEKNGTSKYISPDKLIDSSTALFPDYTWYIKNNLHNPFHNCFNALLFEMCYSEEQMTVESNPTWPQYLYYNDTDGSCCPLTEDNIKEVDQTVDYTTNIFTAYYRFLKAVFDYFSLLIKNIWTQN